MAALDDHPRAWSFDELVRDGISLIPAYAPKWTNHNPSDPGITLIELLAYFSEILAYRALRITPDAKLYFLHLLEEGSSSDALRDMPSTVVEEAIRDRVRVLSQAQCAVTARDFERIAMGVAASDADPGITVHAVCVPGVHLRQEPSTSHRSREAPADVSVVLKNELAQYQIFKNDTPLVSSARSSSLVRWASVMSWKTKTKQFSPFTSTERADIRPGTCTPLLCATRGNRSTLPSRW